MITQIGNIVGVIVVMSLSGGALALLLALLKPLIRNRLPKSAQYYIWLVVLAALLIPVSELIVMPDSPANIQLAPIHAVVKQGINIVETEMNTPPSKADDGASRITSGDTSTDLSVNPAAVQGAAQEVAPATAQEAAPAATQEAAPTAAQEAAPATVQEAAPAAVQEAAPAAVQEAAPAAVQEAAPAAAQEAAPAAVQEAAPATAPMRIPAYIPIALFIVIYPLVAIIIMLYNILSYIRFVGKIRRSRTRARKDELYDYVGLCGDAMPPRLYRSTLAVTPMLIGFFKPEIILPDREYSDAEFQSVLRHELIHLRRRDIVVKWLSVTVCALHWFNPAVWLARREIDHACELSCDEAVIRDLDSNGKQDYGNTLIAVAADTNASRPVLSTTMCEEKKALKERLHSIMMHQKLTWAVRFISVAAVVASVCIVCILGAGAKPLPVEATNPAPYIEPGDEPSEDPSKEPSEEPSKELSQKLSEEPAEEPSKESSEEPFEEPSEKSSEELPENYSKESSNEPNEEPSKAPSGGADNIYNIDTEEFYMAFFEEITNLEVKTSIPAVIMRFHGYVQTINPDAFTNIVVTRDGTVVNNPISFNGVTSHFVWSNEEVTDFYFVFKHEINEPGRYSLTGRYGGMLFEVYDKIIEKPVGDAPADPAALQEVRFAYYPDHSDNPKRVAEVGFCFKGIQQSFYESDLTDLKLTRNGSEVKFSFQPQVFRYLETEGSSVVTMFYLLFLGSGFSTPGTYQLTGNYRGTAFASIEISIP